ncbi:MAG: T9SS type A sorting domain-containing protein [Bacteroidales bacterium]
MKKATLLLTLTISYFVLIGQTRIGVTHLEQDFSSGITSLGWTIENQASNWSTVSSNNAGGVAPEARMSWEPQFNNTTRLISPSIDLSEFDDIVLEFKHAIDHYEDKYNVGIATRSNQGDWTTVWSMAGEDIVETKYLEINNADSQSSDFQLCIFFSGNSYNINYWYIDDIVLYSPFDLDVMTKSIELDSYMESGTYDITTTLINAGKNNINSFDIEYIVNDNESIVETVDNVSLESMETYTHTFSSQWTANPGVHQIKVKVTNVNGMDDDDVSNNEIEKTISIASNTVSNVPLFESFTSSTCPPCYTFNTSTFTPFLNENEGEYSIVKYQMNWPGGGDPYYNDEGGVRRNYYGVTGVPALYTSGLQTATNETGLNNSFSAIKEKPAFFEIDATGSIYSDNTIHVSIDVTPFITVNNFSLHVAVTERETTGNTGNNGETSFKNVMMKMLPDADGTPLNSIDGETINYSFEGNMAETFVEEFDDLMLTIFIQNNETKDVFQSKMIDVSTVTTHNLSFSIVNSNDNSPIEDATVAINETEIITNAEGNAEISLPDGTYPFSVSKEGFDTYHSEATINGSDENVNVELMTTTNVNSTSETDFCILPNPNNGVFKVSLPVNAGVSTINIYSITGTLILNKKIRKPDSTISLNISQPQGVYILKVTLENGKELTRKLIIE